jgi:hypothetical protein
MDKDVAQYVRNCHTCRRTKASREGSNGTLKPLPIPEHRWEDVSVDFVVDLPASKNLWGVLCKNIMVVVDRLSKERHYIGCNDMSAKAVAGLYYHYVWKIHGLPKTCVSDRGTQFISHFWKQLCKRLGIRRLLSTSHHPQTDGQTENANAAMEHYLRCYVDYAQDNWAELLPGAEFAANNHCSESTGITPFFANKGYHPRMGFEPPESAVTRDLGPHHRIDVQSANQFADRMDKVLEFCKDAMCVAQARQEEAANRRRTPAPAYKVGDKVYLDMRNVKTLRPSKKLDVKNEGPFSVAEAINSHAYRLALPKEWKIHDVFHVSRLRLDSNDPLPGQTPTNPNPVPVANEDGNETHDEWHFKRILNSRVVGRGRTQRPQYFVEWTNYAPSWTNAEDLAGCDSDIRDFHSRNPHKPGPWIHLTPLTTPEVDNDSDQGSILS